jgi:hypothetical protein
MYPKKSHSPAPFPLERGDSHAFHFAAEYRDRGWNVLPLQGKTPAVSHWKELQTRRATEDERRDWFLGTGLDVGIVTGKISGLVVIDCDTEEEVAYWLDHYPASPLTVRTGGGGAHFYYQAHSEVEVRNGTHLFGRAIDVRGEGGYVVAPPSRHASGRPYAWINETSYRLESVPVVDPAWFEDGLTSERMPSDGTCPIRHPAAYIQKIQAVSGERGHDQTYRAACILRDAGLSSQETLRELTLWNRTHAHPPWSPGELVHKVKSVFQALRHTEDTDT